jgi:hypothetical protein
MGIKTVKKLYATDILVKSSASRANRKHYKNVVNTSEPKQLRLGAISDKIITAKSPYRAQQQ